LDPESLARCLTPIMDNLSRDRNYYAKEGDTNNRIIREKFNFDRNIGILMSDLEQIIQESGKK